MRLVAAITGAALLTLAGCGGAGDTDASNLATLPDAVPGAIVALRADGDRVEYADRLAGQLFSISTTAADDIELLATVAVSTDGEQRGLLGHTVIADRRYAAWTDPDTFDLVVGDITSGAVDRIVWSGTGTRSTAIGGHLDSRQGQLVLSLGSLTGWALNHGSGALVTLDPNGPPDQLPAVLSDGWNNPFAFIVNGDDVWVADNSPDGSDLPAADRQPERIGRADVTDAQLTELPLPQRAASAIVVLPDGRLGVCGFLDGEMWGYELFTSETADEPDSDNSPAAAVARAGTIGPCLTGAAVLDDGSVVTASTNDSGASTLLRRSP